MPTFSIIIPSHNGADRITKALESCLSQSYQDFEIIVVCDACTDNTAEIACSLGAKVVNVDFHRDGLSRNAGLDIATGDWILFLDDDDWWLHEFALSTLWPYTFDDSADVINFAIIWRTVGYKNYNPGVFMPMAAGHCWRRTFIGDTRFDDAQFSSDTHFLEALVAKKPSTLSTGQPLYYYNYMRDGSLTDLHKKGVI